MKHGKNIKHLLLYTNVDPKMIPLLNSLETKHVQDFSCFQAKKFCITGYTPTSENLSTFPLYCDDVHVQRNVIIENLPIEIQKLTLMCPFQFSNMKSNLNECQSLTYLHIEDVGKIIITKFPPNLETLYISNARFKLVPGIFPNTLKKLTVDVDDQYLKIGLFPNHLIYLKIYGLQKNLVCGIFPQTLKMLILKHYSKIIPIGVLPTNLQKLTVWTHCNESVLPKTIKKLKCKEFDNVVPSFPEFLSSLSIWKPVKHLHFPKNLTSFKVSRLPLFDSKDVFKLDEWPQTLRKFTTKTDGNHFCHSSIGYWNKRTGKNWTLYLYKNFHVEFAKACQ
jgi:hypothetical protein